MKSVRSTYWGQTLKTVTRMVAGLAILAGLLAPVAGGLSGSPPAFALPVVLPPIGHVFVIVLENKGYASTFGNPSADPYLARDLPTQGALLTQYYATGHVSNDNYISMVSGQGPNVQNQLDCQIYDDFLGTGPTPLSGQALGTGCVYPASVPNIGNQFSAASFSWKGYMQDMGNVGSRESPNCGHPALNSQDTTQTAVPGDGYVTRHNPFVYFHSVIDSAAYCAAHVVPLGSVTGTLPVGVVPGTTGLATDLAHVATTPNLSYIVPNVCNDGHDYPCINQASGRSALADIDAFLRTWVPLIVGSPAFVQDGLLLVTFDESDGPQADSSSCCGETLGPNTLLPGILPPGLTGLGGGRTGTVAISPFIKPGTVSNVAYNHYSLLASIEDQFGLSRLGYAADTTSTFGSDVFTK